MATIDDPDIRWRWRRADGRLIAQFYDPKTDSWWELNCTYAEWKKVAAEIVAACGA